MPVSYLPMLVFACAGLLLAQPAASLQQATLTRYTDNTCTTKSKPEGRQNPVVVEYTLGVCNTLFLGSPILVNCDDPQNPTFALYDSCDASKKLIAADTPVTTGHPDIGYKAYGLVANPDKLKSAACTKFSKYYIELTCPTPASPASPPNSVVDIVQYTDAHCTEKSPEPTDPADINGLINAAVAMGKLVHNDECEQFPGGNKAIKISCADWKKPTVFWSMKAAPHETAADVKVCKPCSLPKCTTVYTPGKCSSLAYPGESAAGPGFVKITCAAPVSTPPPTAGSAPAPPPASTGLGGGAIFGIIIAVLVGVAGLAAGALFFLKKGPFAPKGMSGASIYETSPGGNH